MLTLPTDRLHKFLAIGGLALIVIGVTYPIQQYNEAELRRIDAFEKAQRVYFAYGRFAQKVNEGIAIYNRTVKERMSPEEARPFKDQILKKLPEMEELDREVADALVQLQKHVELMMHFYFMRNLWFTLGLCFVVSGIYLSYRGFRQWLSQPKKER